MENLFYSQSFNWILLIAIAIVGMIVQGRLKGVFAKYSRVPLASGLTGREVAERMLRANGITDVRVTSTPGQLTDHFDPRNKTVNLSEGVYNSASVAAAAVAAHECGHAVQHATQYAPLRLRSALVPLINITSRWAIWVIIAGILLINSLGPRYEAIYWVGICMIAASALFALVTLPVEYNASRRAMAWLEGSGTIYGEQVAQARTALSWAARTYLVAALSAVVTLIYYLGFRRD
jgi:Zn-dependent membrane protease YugP